MVDGSGRSGRAAAVGVLVALAAAWAAFAIERGGRAELLARYEALAEASERGARELDGAREARARLEAEAAEREARLVSAEETSGEALRMRLAAAGLALEALRPAKARALLEEVAPEERGFEWGSLSLQAELLAPTAREHVAWLSAVALSDDGALLATADEDGELLLGPSAVGAAAELLAAGQDVVHALAFSPGGRLVAAASAEGAIHLFTTAPPAELAALEGHEDAVLALAFADEERLVSAGEDGTLRVWDVDERRELHAFAPFDGLPIDLAARAGRFVAASDEGELALFDVERRELVRALEADDERWLAVALSGDGRRVAAGGVGRTVFVLDAETGARVAELPGAVEPIVGLWLDERGERALAASRDGALRLFDVSAGIELLRFDAGPRGLERVAADRGGTRVAFFQPAEERARLWRRPPPRASTRLEAHDKTALALCATPDGARWYAGRADGTLQLLDAASGEVLAERRVTEAALRALALSPDGALLAAGAADGGLQLLDARTLALLRVLEGHERHVVDLRFQPDGAKLSSAALDGSLALWRVADGELVARKPGPRQYVLACALSADGALGLWVAGGGVVRLWELESGARAGGFRDLSLGRVTSMALTPDARRVVLVTGESTARVFDVRTGALVAEAPPRPELVAELAASPDGLRFAAGGFDGSVRLFELASARELLRLPGGDRSVAALRFAPDGGRLAAALSNGPLELWERALEPWREARAAR